MDMLCAYCTTDTGGNHQVGCPQSKPVPSETFGRAGAGIEAAAAKIQIDTLRAEVAQLTAGRDNLRTQMRRLADDILCVEQARRHSVRECRGLRKKVERLRAPIKPCHWDAGRTECGHPIIPGLEENDDAEFCPYCGGRMEVWVTMGLDKAEGT